MNLFFRRLRQWRRIRSLKIERRKILKSIEPGQLLSDIENVPSKLHEEVELLDTIDKGLVVLEWLELRSRAAGLGLFMDWSTEKADELFSDKELDTFKKEIRELRQIIRKEQNERWQFWELRLRTLTTFFGALAGVIGTAIGLIAILRK